MSFLSGVNPNGSLATTSYWTDVGATAHKWGSTAAGTAATVIYSFDPTAGYTTTEMNTVIEAMKLWSALTNITFVAGTTSSTSGLTFTKNTVGSASTSVSTYFGRSIEQTAAATVTIDTASYGFDLSGSFSSVYGYGLGTIVHELGHVLGLGHAGNYNGSANPSTQQNNQFDTRLWSAMSYIAPDNSSALDYSSYSVTGTTWGGTVNSSAPQSSTTWMPLDVLAAQRLYGAATTGPLSGGQVFGFHCNVDTSIKPFFDFTQNTTPVVTLYDSGTGNTLDLSGYSTSEVIDLRGGHFSSFAGLANNLGIAFGTKIDTADGGSGTDLYYTNGDGDTINGGSGTNTVYFANSLASYTITEVTAQEYTVTEGSEVNTLNNVQSLVFADQTVSLNCFLAGTPILTPAGEVAVEDLRAGCEVLTISGRPARVWRLVRRHVPQPSAAMMPVRIRAHSFGAGQPCRDLYLSREHAVFTGDVLIPIRALIDGGNVARVAMPDVTYLHIQLERHDVVLASGLACETYLEHDDDMFDGQALAPSELSDMTPYAPIRAQGPEVEAARMMLRRAALAEV